MERDEGFYNRVGVDRIASRQIDELVGLARGVCADGTINQAEAEFLEKWLAASGSVSDQPVIDKLYARISEMLGDGQLDDDERLALFETLDEFGNGDLELGELLKSTTLPLCRPAPHLEFVGRRFTFTGTFSFGQRAVTWGIGRFIDTRNELSCGRSLRDRIVEAFFVWYQDHEGL
jgi:hypothetical protein